MGNSIGDDMIRGVAGRFLLLYWAGLPLTAWRLGRYKEIMTAKSLLISNE